MKEVELYKSTEIKVSVCYCKTLVLSAVQIAYFCTSTTSQAEFLLQYPEVTP
jgi:hypothetical protein